MMIDDDDDDSYDDNDDDDDITVTHSTATFSQKHLEFFILKWLSAKQLNVLGKHPEKR